MSARSAIFIASLIKNFFIASLISNAYCFSDIRPFSLYVNVNILPCLFITMWKWRIKNLSLSIYLLVTLSWTIVIPTVLMDKGIKPWLKTSSSETPHVLSRRAETLSDVTSWPITAVVNGGQYKCKYLTLNTQISAYLLCIQPKHQSFTKWFEVLHPSRQ